MLGAALGAVEGEVDDDDEAVEGSLAAAYDSTAYRYTNAFGCMLLSAFGSNAADTLS